MKPRALRVHVGPRARRHIERHGLRPQDVCVIPGAAGGPKGLILNHIDRFLFGQWLPASSQPVHLLGASIGSWRMAAACMDEPVAALKALEQGYITQHYVGRPPPREVSRLFGERLRQSLDGHVGAVLRHPRYRLHVVTSRGRHVLRRDGLLRTPLGYAGAWLSNAVQRPAMGHWIERVIFSDRRDPLPIHLGDYRTRTVHLTGENLLPAIQASCSIPFLLQAVHDIPGAPTGAYWDGGITDYHLHLNYASIPEHQQAAGLVLYPHFQQAVVPGWLDKGWKLRHRPTPFLDNLVLLAPDPAWVATLPNGKLPDRTDFRRYMNDYDTRVRVWQQASDAGEALAEDFARWLEHPQEMLAL